MQRRLQDTLDYYKESLKLQPDFVIALLGTGRTYIAMNHGRLALRPLEKAAQLAPKVAEIQYNLAEAYLLTGQMEQARSIVLYGDRSGTAG